MALPKDPTPSPAPTPAPVKPSAPRKPVDLASESVAGEEDPGAALDDIPAQPKTDHPA